MRTTLAEMDHQKPPTPAELYNKETNSIVNGMEKQKRYRAINMRLDWVRDRIRKNHFYIFWEENKTLAYYITKHHPIWHHITMRPRYVNSTKKDIENSKYRRTGTIRVCAGTTNPGGTKKQENPIKVIRNPIPPRPDNFSAAIRIPFFGKDEWSSIHQSEKAAI